MPGQFGRDLWLEQSRRRFCCDPSLLERLLVLLGAMDANGIIARMVRRGSLGLLLLFKEIRQLALFELRGGI
jgi:hypothetical protein